LHRQGRSAVQAIPTLRGTQARGTQGPVIGSSATDTSTTTYKPDNQLIGITHTNSSLPNESFAFDLNGNNTAGGNNTPSADRLSTNGTFNFVYDNEGNLITKTQISTGNKTTYTWDYRNRLTEVDSTVNNVTSVVARYTYDVYNRRIKTVVGTTTRWTAYDGDQPILDFDGNGNLTARYLWDPYTGQILSRDTPSGGLAWYLTDPQGNVREVTGGKGAVMDHIDYSAFGNILSESVPSKGDRFKFAGLEYDSETGLNHADNRYQDPTTGRWISEDPIGFGGGDANLYRYVLNTPPNAIDPSGQAGESSNILIFISNHTTAKDKENWERIVSSGSLGAPTKIFDNISSWAQIRVGLATVPDHSITEIHLSGDGAYERILDPSGRFIGAGVGIQVDLPGQSDTGLTNRNIDQATLNMIKQKAAMGAVFFLDGCNTANSPNGLSQFAKTIGLETQGNLGAAYGGNKVTRDPKTGMPAGRVRALPDGSIKNKKELSGIFFPGLDETVVKSKPN
jgi:RHS repeat-associated protein